MSKKRKIEEIREEERKKAEAEACGRAEAEGVSASSSPKTTATGFRKAENLSPRGKHEAAPTAEELACFIHANADAIQTLTAETNRFQVATGNTLREYGRIINDHEVRLRAVEGSLGGKASAAPSPVVAPATGADSIAREAAPTVPASSVAHSPAMGGMSIGKAYRYWHAESRTWRLSADIWAAKQASNGLYDIVWVMYHPGGHIDHLLSEEEIQRYTPR